MSECMHLQPQAKQQVLVQGTYSALKPTCWTRALQSGQTGVTHVQMEHCKTVFPQTTRGKQDINSTVGHCGHPTQLHTAGRQGFPAIPLLLSCARTGGTDKLESSALSFSGCILTIVTQCSQRGLSGKNYGASQRQ